MHTTDSKSRNEEDDGPEHDDNALDEENLFEHIKKADQVHNALTRDAATDEQAKEQLGVLQQEEDKEKEQPVDDDVVMKEDEPEDPPQDAEELKAEVMPKSTRKSRKRGDPQGMEKGTEETPMEGKSTLRKRRSCCMPESSFCCLVEGDVTLTMSVSRGPESTFVTQTDLVPLHETAVPMETVEQLRNDLEQRLSTWSTTHVSTCYTFFSCR